MSLGAAWNPCLLVLIGVVGATGCSGGGGGSSAPGFSVADVAVDEGDAGTSNVTITVSLSSPVDEETRVSFAGSVVSGADAATGGTDYIVPIPNTLVFDAGVTTRTFQVAVVGDTLDELDERFGIQLLLPVGPVGLADSLGVVTIRDDDPQSALSIDDVAIDEGDAGTSSLAFTITLAPASGREVRVAHATSNGTASAGSDYVAASGTRTFAAGQTSQSVVVTINGDGVVENDESFSMVLSAPVGATLADATGIGLIRNDDAPSGDLGLDARPANPTCVAPARPTSASDVDIEEAFPTAPNFSSMTKILQAPGDGTRWFVLEKSGRIKVLPIANPAAAATWIDLSDRVEDPGEGGLLGMAFHPSWPGTRQVFVSYTAAGSPLVSRISRLILDDVSTPSPPTEQILLTVDQPFENHNGGEIAFGPDGYLYFGLGDGGDGDDPFNLSQNPTRLLGKMLRIGVVGVGFPSPAYTIPPDNPNAANAKCGPGTNAQACPEIYATGFRNPWRFGFDPPTGALYVGDVGENSREEIDLVELGGNYGWNCREGTIAHASSGDCSGAFIEPLVDIAHSTGNFAVTGGYVYRGSDIPGLEGRYVFGDFQSGNIFALVPDGSGGFTTDLLVSSGSNNSAFGVDAQGELHVASFTSGRILRLVPSGGGGGNTIPSDLEDTGCAAPGDPAQPSSGLVPYGLQAPFWSDGAAKSRWLGIPDGTTIAIGSISGSAGGDFTLPTGSVIRKDFRLNGQLIETRLLMRHPDGIWGGYTYEWNDAQTAATRVIGGKLRDVQGQSWIYPSEAACLQCHTATAGFALGPEVSQLNGNLTYPSTGRTANQLDTLAGVGYFSAPLPGPAASLPRLADPVDVGASLGSRARAWLHTNCSQCHRPGGPTPSSMDLRASTALSATNACNVAPQSGSFGIASARLVAVGDPARSIVVYRANRRDANGMPPIGSHLVDAAGVALLEDWIESLASCN